MASSAGHLDAATQQLGASLAKVTGAPVDLQSASWADIEKGVIRLLMGPFHPEQPEHQLVALGLAGAFADRLIASDQAFWFPHREAPDRASDSSIRTPASNAASDRQPGSFVAMAPVWLIPSDERRRRRGPRKSSEPAYSRQSCSRTSC